MSYTTTPLQWNADTSDVESALATIGAGPVTVSRIGPDLVNGFSWIITFTATYTNYDVPLLV